MLFDDLANVKFGASPDLIYSLLKQFQVRNAFSMPWITLAIQLCYDFTDSDNNSGLLFPCLLPHNDDADEVMAKWRDTRNEEGVKHIGARWGTSMPGHVIPFSVYQHLQVHIRTALHVQQNTRLWWRGMHIAQQDRDAVIRQETDMNFFDIIVWGKHPLRLLELIQTAIARFFQTHFPGMQVSCNVSV